MKYNLTNSDIAFIAEMRTEGICWKLIAKIFNRHHKWLEISFYKKMQAGF